MKPKEGIQITSLATNISVVINKGYKLEDIKSELEKSFNRGERLNTYQQFIESLKKETETESKALEFIQILVIIITGVGISVTTLLLTLKRKRDYVLFSIYGMEDALLGDLILYETFVICIIGIIIGSCLSFIITGFLEKTIISEIGINTVLIQSILPVGITITHTSHTVKHHKTLIYLSLRA
ncbi:MAG TPA: FtsX-like permease family protein [Clostridiaceae bacterium]